MLGKNLTYFILMKEKLNFLIKINKLKETPRTGWVLRNVKNPETIAEHIFRVAIASWILSAKRGLNVKRAIKVALSHDLCEVYAGDVTPFFYYINLPKDKKKRKEVLKKWVRLSKKEKEKRGKKKFEKEKKGLLRLIKNLKPKLRRDIFSNWFDYEKGVSKEGKFVKQVDKIETLIQAVEYFGSGKDTPVVGWWEEIEEITEDALLLDFLKIIQKKFYRKKIKISKENQGLENILEFLLDIGKLKKMPRMYWVIREVKNPETVAGHIFTLVLMAWVFGSEKEKKYNIEKLLKMALCHEISAVYTGDTTPYDDILPKDKKKRRKLLERWTRLSKKEKTKKFIKDYQNEKKALEKLTNKLDRGFKKEIIQLWDEYRTRSTPEGYFLSQLNVLAVLLQALSYEEKKSFLAAPIWEWAFEKCDDKICFQFFDEIKRKFY